MEIEKNLKHLQLNAGASEHVIKEVISVLTYVLPNDYIEFLRLHDGGEGFIGNNYLILWKIDELIEFNREYEVEKYVPGLLLFASSGGGAGYGFDFREASVSIVSVEFIGMSWNEVDRIANNFTDFLYELAK